MEGLKRDDLVTIAVSGDHGKPHPALIVQDDAFAELPFVTLLQLTSDVHDEHLIRITVESEVGNGVHNRHR
jgi:mRNA interferase MazF